MTVERLTRAESKALTRRRLLDAARRVFLRDGFHATSVDQIAAEAGYTKGALYSAFESKAEVFLALFEERVAERAAAYSGLADGLTWEAQVEAAARAWAEVLRNEREWSLVLIEFWAFAARDDDLRRRFGELHGRMRTAIARIIERAADRSGQPLALPTEVVAMANMALGNGFTLEALAGPEPAAVESWEAVAVLLGRAVVESDGGGR